MADSEHLKILKSGVEKWNSFVSDGGDKFVAKLSWADLTGADLNEAKLNRADLSGADLSGADLFRAKLNEADLNGANLNGANLNEADLNEADLNGAKLNEADLNGANLNEANLNEAKLSRANLSRANFTGANLVRAHLNGTNLSESILSRTIFGDVDLSDVKGLDAIVHRGPSTVGIDTIYASKGNIPEVFLRGAGVPDIFIEYMSSLTCNPLEFYSCFISYSHADKDFARRLHDRLQGNGIRCWLDEHQLVPGDDLHDRIDQGIKIWDKVILCCSEAALTSWWVDKELDRALQKEESLWKERQQKVLAIIPVDLDGFVHSWDEGKAGMVKSRFIGDFKQWEVNNEFETSFESLLKALRTPEGREPAPTPKL